MTTNVQIVQTLLSVAAIMTYSLVLGIGSYYLQPHHYRFQCILLHKNQKREDCANKHFGHTIMV